jgi:hypothetical protein
MAVRAADGTFLETPLSGFGVEMDPSIGLEGAAQHAPGRAARAGCLN